MEARGKRERFCIIFFSALAALEHKWVGVNTVSHLRSEAAGKACDAGAQERVSVAQGGAPILRHVVFS